MSSPCSGRVSKAVTSSASGTFSPVSDSGWSGSPPCPARFPEIRRRRTPGRKTSGASLWSSLQAVRRRTSPGSGARSGRPSKGWLSTPPCSGRPLAAPAAARVPRHGFDPGRRRGHRRARPGGGRRTGSGRGHRCRDAGRDRVPRRVSRAPRTDRGAPGRGARRDRLPPAPRAGGGAAARRAGSARLPHRGGLGRLRVVRPARRGALRIFVSTTSMPTSSSFATGG